MITSVASPVLGSCCMKSEEGGSVWAWRPVKFCLCAPRLVKSTLRLAICRSRKSCRAQVYVSAGIVRLKLAVHAVASLDGSGSIDFGCCCDGFHPWRYHDAGIPGQSAGPRQNTFPDHRALQTRSGLVNLLPRAAMESSRRRQLRSALTNTSEGMPAPLTPTFSTSY